MFLTTRLKKNVPVTLKFPAINYFAAGQVWQVTGVLVGTGDQHGACHGM